MKAAKFFTNSKSNLVAGLLMLGINGAGVNAQGLDQAGNNNVAARLIKYEVKPEYQDQFRKTISEYVLYAVKMESNILSEAYYEENNTSVLWLIERWINTIEQDKISNSIPFKAITFLSKAALQRPAEIIPVKDLEPLAKQQWRVPANKADKPISIMLFVDSKAGTANKFKSVYHAAMPQFRSEPGVINYQLSQLESDSTQFVTYEKFRGEDAFQFHLKFPPIQPVIDYLETSIKKQPFQAGLHRLIEFAPIIRQ